MKCKECKKSDCKHENVKYHSCCFKVRCEDCGQEWEVKAKYYPPIVPHYIYTYTVCNACGNNPCSCWQTTYWQGRTGNSISCNVTNCQGF